MVDMREFMTEVENQAGVNSCAANAIVGAFEYILARSGDKVDFSRLFVYYNARHLGNFLTVRWAAAQAAAEGKEFDPDDDDLYAITDDGCRTINAFRALKVYGVCREETWDYEVKTFARVPKVNTRPSEEAFAEAKSLKESPRFQWETPETLPRTLFAMKHCLAEGYPFVFGLVLFEQFIPVGQKHGHVAMPDLETESTAESHGRHAMVCVGYKESAQVFIVRNSWGITWGDKGYCYIPYAYMTNPDLCYLAFKAKGHHFGMDLLEGVWKEDDGDFGPAFYEMPAEEDETMIFGLEEAIAVVSFVGMGADGITLEEQRKLMDLFTEYKIDPANLKYNMDKVSSLGEGLKTCYDGAVKIILSYNEAMMAFRISAEFAFADGKLTREEQKY